LSVVLEAALIAMGSFGAVAAISLNGSSGPFEAVAPPQEFASI
jgi:hypothetical protein